MSIRTLKRRAFIGGSGALITLPWLESLRIKSAEAQSEKKTVKRFLAFYHPNGLFDRANEWTPKQTGTNYTMTRTLGGGEGNLYSGIRNIRNKTLIVSGLTREYAHNEPGAHHSGGGAVLTCRQVSQTSVNAGGISIDQLIAQRVGNLGVRSSIQLGLESTASAYGDNPYAAAYSGCISWATPTQPLAVINDPIVAFNLLFSGTSPSMPDPAAERRRKLRLSVLDTAVQDATSLKQKLSAVDRLKLDEYLTGVRELEVRIKQNSAFTQVQSCTSPVQPATQSGKVAQMKAMADVMVLAFQCNATRVISFMLGHSKSEANYPDLGIAEDHHGTLSHLFTASGEADRADKQNKLLKLEAWSLSQLAYIAEKLDAIEEENGTTALDNSLLFFSSEVGHSENHTQTNMPMLIIGGSNGAIATGQHVRHADKYMNNVYVNMLNAFGISDTSFGDPTRCTGPLPGINVG